MPMGVPANGQLFGPSLFVKSTWMPLPSRLSPVIVAVAGQSATFGPHSGGAFGVAVLSPQGGYGEGLSHDGRTLVLQSMGLAAKTQFALVNTSDLTTRDRISLNGTFAFDALSPDGSRLYLIEHTSLQDVQRAIAGMGKSVGPPWTKDHKEAALAAAMILARA